MSGRWVALLVWMALTPPWAVGWVLFAGHPVQPGNPRALGVIVLISVGVLAWFGMDNAIRRMQR